ncbi:MAG TPA: [FeFe] hydrogenase H-cluster radical SAM maturase HydE [Selenomonas sp.]|nr:[FeFe] hydrogenase H-cluster radical SAM maturase HydE [Selenomonas sp.]
MESIINRLARRRDLSDEEFAALLETASDNDEAYLAQCARQVREKYYGKDVYIRGLIEFTNHCRNNCYYCGIRRDNKSAMRYRLSAEQILSCCDSGYQLGFRTFVLQGGEDAYFTDERLCGLIRDIKRRHSDCAVTLSIGEREKSSFIKLFEAGADRYLLRHETADKSHYEQLHPGEMSHSHRLQCLRDLKSIGYQVGCGMMVGSPGQRTEHIIKDLRMLQEFQPEMVGIGPFIPQHDTPFGQEKAGTAAMTLRLLSIIRLLLPNVLLPATTALGTIDPKGREKGLMAGANVLMPNLSPTDVRRKYALYDNKICTGEEAAECVRCLAARVETTGYRIVISRGDHISR